MTRSHAQFLLPRQASSGQEPSGCGRVLTSAGYTGRPRVPPSNTANSSLSG